MKRFARLGSLTVGALLLAAAGAPAQDRPHTLSGTGHFTSPTDFVSEGIATHLGTFDETGSAVLTPTDDPAVLQVDGSSTLTAANGDQVREVISGRLNVLTGAATGTITYVGGTGRFANASGTVALSLQFLPDGSFKYSGEGTIDY
jgi:hypothetical protein